ncbi:MAG: serine/threonine-protein kinase [Proteobacteria bacterium]|nr:serine/threonine-protein kinase [Pseudomonadota bacterium]
MEQFGPWLLESLIAVGGMGEVWRGTREDGQVAAVKRLHSHLARNDEARALFTNEQHLLTTLPPHPNLIEAIEAGTVVTEASERPYVALALAAGQDVRSLVAPAGTILPRARVRAIVLAACDAVAHLQAHGWVHGDVCPGNLVVDDADHVKLVDLGVVRRIGEGGPMRGTHAYMAPEQVRGEPWTCATDVFALGVVLWELVAGARLFHRGPPWLTMAAVIEAVPDPLADPPLDAIVRAALAKDPAARTPTAAALAAQLRALR